MSAESVCFEGCSFGYRRNRTVIEALDFGFPAGRSVFLGPNGAGKSTVLGLAASALQPRSGSVRLGELSPRRGRDLKAYRQKVAWMPQQIDCVPGLTAREQVAYVGWLKGMSRAEAWSRAVDALRRVELEDHQDRKVSELSGGQKRRVGVAQSLVHGAEVLLLDEPTAGMDPRQRRVFHEVLGALPEEVSVVLSTHDVADLDEIYDNVVVLNAGTIRFSGPVKQFLAHASADAAPGRRAESAYDSIVGGVPAC
ncbi:ABC transporter [Streptomyces viridochromogenes]|uniref:ABC transporter n=1 Tax=Streptomyces viridochromogenes TaxID=1938 RepID=A0A0J7Z7F4_STRVR|nr:ATP-binding cassette domain-containing protein [Streptomyces viridochromogenes]KMS71437.1 ABC transporter [Streptomyces viridochromogenes]KOG17173.1 ABC transporter [Streptomyces viridochromogenes]KOG20194.1 ABC transporter [Streptomyces viridochromogenes]